MRRVVALAAIAALIAAPSLLARPGDRAAPGAETLIVLTPHNEYLRLEFSAAFTAWARDALHRDVAIDWRTGGTSDLTKQVDGRFADAAWQALGVALASHDEAEVARARAALAASDVGIGADLFFGGGPLEFRQMADKGYLVDAGVRALEPTWFGDDAIAETIGGEPLYDAKGRWYGVALASFGVCASPDRCAALGVPLPKAWSDLGDPRLAGAVAIGDPTKSGSVNVCYEMIVQGRMRATAGDSGERAALDAGWRDGFLLVKRIVANARAVDDSAARVVREVARGDAAAGMAIASYGRLQAEWTARESGGTERLVYADPTDGTAITPDPIGVLRGAPHRDLAAQCVRFALSPEWQRRLCYRLGAPGGPRRYALRLLPVRRDCYGAGERAYRSDPDVDPYALAARFRYHAEWTGPYFGVIRQLIKAVALDPRPELADAWRAIVAAGGPDAVPEAMAELAWLPFAWHDAGAAKKQLTGDPVAIHARLRGWTEEARAHYAAAERIARAQVQAER